MRAVRRLLAHGLLALALLLAQAGALTHAVAHFSELPAGLADVGADADAGLDTEDSPQHLAYCTGCLAFSGLDLPFFAHPPFPLASPCLLVPAAQPPAGTACSEGLLPHCRAPPARA